MNQIIHFPIKDILPERDTILLNEGIDKKKLNSDKIYELISSVNEIFTNCVDAQGIMREISQDEFEIVYKGEGQNAEFTPLELIFPKANKLALFALTLGNVISKKIDDLFAKREYALAYMLDSIASLSADKAVKLCEMKFANQNENDATLSYSPGYCGWNIDGQKKLFNFLTPSQIGISLKESFLMEPLKSVTGVLVSGKKEIHFFKNCFNFCKSCETKSCRDRMKKMKLETFKVNE